MLLTRRINMQTHHINQLTRNTTTQLMRMPAQTLGHDCVIPTREAILTTQHELDSWVKQFQCFGPLNGALCVEFRILLFDLPCSPDFVAEGPVLDVIGFFVAIFATEVCVVCVEAGVAVF